MFSNRNLIDAINNSKTKTVELIVDTYLLAKEREVQLNENFFNTAECFEFKNLNHYHYILPLHAAIQTGHFAMVETLLKLWDVDLIDLNATIRSGHINQFFKEEDDQIETALCLATRLGFDRMVALLIKHGADVTIAGLYKGEYKTPIIIAIQEKNYTIVRLLITANGPFKKTKDCKLFPLVELIKHAHNDELTDDIDKEQGKQHHDSDSDEDSLDEETNHFTTITTKQLIEMVIHAGQSQHHINHALMYAAKVNHTLVMDMLFEHVDIDSLTRFFTKKFRICSIEQTLTPGQQILKEAYIAATTWKKIQDDLNHSDEQFTEKVVTEKLSNLLELSYHPIIKNRLHYIIGAYLFEKEQTAHLTLCQLAMRFLLPLNDQKTLRLKSAIMDKLKNKVQADDDVFINDVNAEYESLLTKHVEQVMNEFEEITLSPRSLITQPVSAPITIPPSPPRRSFSFSATSFLSKLSPGRATIKETYSPNNEGEKELLHHEKGKEKEPRKQPALN